MQVETHVGRRTKQDIGRVVLGVGSVAVLLGLFAVLAYSIFAPARRTYSQATPDAVLESAMLMVKNGDARLLTKLIYADSPEMRQTLNRLGLLLQNMQGLAGEIQRSFPEEIAAYRAKTEQELKEGKTPAFLAAISGAIGRGGNANIAVPTEGKDRSETESAVREFVARQFSDPFGWLEQNSKRLSTLTVTDDQATVTLDGQPVGGIGIPLQLAEDGNWYVKLPTGMPPLSDVLPKAKPQWTMFNSLIQLLDNTVVELTTDVRSGHLRNLKSIGDKAQEKVIFPGALWFTAYSADLDARKRVDRYMRTYRERQKAWAKAREERGSMSGGEPSGSGGGVSPKLLSALSKIATEELTAQVRARKAPAVKDMTDAAFEELIGAWIKKQGLGISLAGTLKGEAIDQAVAQWEEARAGGEGKKPK